MDGKSCSLRGYKSFGRKGKEDTVSEIFRGQDPDRNITGSRNIPGAGFTPRKDRFETNKKLYFLVKKRTDAPFASLIIFFKKLIE